MATLTDRHIKAALASKKSSTRWLTESLGRGNGSLVLKVSADSASWYYRYAVARQSYYWPIGPYGESPALPLKIARIKANELAAECRALSDGNLHAARERQQAEERERQRAEEIARLQAEDASRFTLRRLVELYVEHLKTAAKNYKDAESGLTRHVLTSTYADLPARDLTRRQATEVLRVIVDAGKGRMAAKVRSYLRAAYALALRAEGDATAPAGLLGFGIEANPIADTASLSQFSKARHRALSEAELRELWKRLQALDSVAADACKVQLLTAGQRWAQLLRATVHDLDEDAKTLTLRDPKGRREQPRVHVVPLPPEVLEIVKGRAKLARDLETKWLFTSDGKTRMVQTTPAALLEQLSADMVAAGKATAPFLPSDLRRTAETQLAAMGVSKDLRGQIQSHGLGGVQARHYDRHEYLQEKRTAIDAWAGWLTASKRDAKVTPIHKAKNK